jgi:hypothetical protein
VGRRHVSGDTIVVEWTPTMATDACTGTSRSPSSATDKPSA